MTDPAQLSDAELMAAIGGQGSGAPSPTPAPAQPSASDISQMVAQEAAAQGVPVTIALGLAHQESRFDQTRVSPKGAIGVMQLMPGTAGDLGVDPHDLAQNIKGGITYYKQQRDKFGSDPLALAAYNAGPGAVQKAGGIPNNPETQAYVQAIMGGAG